MKRYALSLKTFEETSELLDILRHLQDTLPGIKVYVDNYMISPIDKGSENDKREQLTILSLFEDFFTQNTGDKGNGVFQKVYNQPYNDSDKKQQTLIDHYSMTEGELLSGNDINLDALVEKGVLIMVESKDITLSKKELDTLLLIVESTINPERTVTIYSDDDDEPELYIYQNHTIEPGVNKRLNEFKVSDIIRICDKLKSEN